MNEKIPNRQKTKERKIKFEEKLKKIEYGFFRNFLKLLIVVFLYIIEII